MPAPVSRAEPRPHVTRAPEIGSLSAAGLPVEETSLAPYLSTRPTGREAVPLARVRPRNVDDIAAVVRWARQHGVPLTTVSSGPGARSRGATAERPTVVVDLSGMDRLLKVDPQDAVAVLEPGVTFGRIDSLLAPHGLRAFKPLLPRAGKSVLASYLEREPNLQSFEQWDVLDPFGGAQLVVTDTRSGVINPATETVIATVPDAGPELLDAAVAAAQGAFPPLQTAE